jgi:CheY-like chemotaxis protein
MTAGTYPGVYMESQDPRRKAILCLCHDKSMLQIRQMLLEHFGYKVFPTSSAEDAAKVAVDECPDMLLLDNGNPEIDFEQVASQVKRACPDLIAVALSPYYYAPRKGRGSIDRFVATDDGPDMLISQIEELFGEQSHHDSPGTGPM